MKANSLVEEKRGRCLDYLPAEFVPSVALSKDVLRAMTAVCFLHGLKDLRCSPDQSDPTRAVGVLPMKLGSPRVHGSSVY